ncbi:MAG: HEAT repeat domain-containing protein [Planctomycetota bacterium]|nr:HEAT repeat domain-containing protein [Planctomycetota bacterium]
MNDFELGALVARLADPDPVVRTQAAKELGKRGPDAAEAGQALALLIADPDPMARSMAAAALGKIGPPAGHAVDALVVMLADPVIPARFWAADALGRIAVDRPNVRQGLETLAQDTHPMAKAASAAARKALRLLDRPKTPE